MPAMDTDCPKCRARMERGFVPDRGDHHTINSSTWTEGEEPTTRWYGKTTKGLQQFVIEAWRCRACGYLEMYARDEP